MVALALGTGVDADAGRRPGPPGPDPARPAPLAPPRLVGSGRIGTPVNLDPGTWSGDPALAFAWARDGAPVPGATGPVYLPGPADDRAALTVRVTATNAAGSAAADTAPLAVTRFPPAAAGALPDQTYHQHSGLKTVNAASDFTGEGLTFGVAGEGVSVDPATGLLSIATEALREGVEVTVTATNSGGAATSRFRVTVAALPVEPEGVAPVATAAPGISGTGKIGSEIVADPGTWTGVPEPALALQWLRDGDAIPGADGPVYVPGTADDGAYVALRVTATNAAGSAQAETEALAVTRVGPAVTGLLGDLVLTQGTGAQAVETARVFAGEALFYSVTGAGATIDAATGRVSIPTAALAAGAEVTVTAANSGGAATASFRVTVIAAVVPPSAVGTLPDVTYELGGGVKTISAQAGFAGTDLVYALTAAPAGVTINAGSGLVSIPTSAPLAAATVTVQASNGAGAATQSFRVTVRSTVTVFDAAGKLADVSFLADSGTPAWSHNANGFARLVPATTSTRVHGAWSKAAGDGLYRCLARWNASNATAAGFSPFVLGGRIAKSGANFTGVYVEFFQPSGGVRRFRAHQFTGAGTGSTNLQSVSPGWEWNTWYWVELEIDGASLRGRFYPEAAAAPAWQLQVAITATGPGSFGPGGYPRNGGSPQIDIKRLEYRPLAGLAAPAAAGDDDWTLGQTVL